MEETKKATIEQKAASAILQKTVEVKIGKHTYKVAPPTVATLILVSEEVSKMPHIETNPENIVRESLWIAKDCRPLGNILAILVLGAKYIMEEQKRCQKASKWRFWRRSESRQQQLADEILLTLKPTEIQDTFVRLLQTMELGDFFGLTTFLTGTNLLHQTKVETETVATASGH